jgi:FkbM family methyltransferase
MFKKHSSYWFAALPSVLALKIFLTFSFKKLFRLPVNFHFSQTGEDVILLSILQKLPGIALKKKGFYIDVGCNQPIEKSNTFLFYLMGWKGITIDANDKLINAHKKIRKLDTPVCAAVSNRAQEVTFYKSDSDAISTIAENVYNANKNYFTYSECQTLYTKTLTSVLDANVPSGTAIDLLSVDVEGIDLAVLQGLDFKKYRPKLIIIEAHDFSTEGMQQHAIYQLLIQNNYRFYGFIVMNAYFVDEGVFLTSEQVN